MLKSAQAIVNKAGIRSTYWIFFDYIKNGLCSSIYPSFAYSRCKSKSYIEKVIKYPDRAEADRFFNYPYAAIEEDLANAVYHKAYDEREPIEVRINKDKIEIISHPGPDRSVTLEGLKNYEVYSRRYRNRRIGDFLKRTTLNRGKKYRLQENPARNQEKWLSFARFRDRRGARLLCYALLCAFSA